jgi:uncharacterized membrane protein
MKKLLFITVLTFAIAMAFTGCKHDPDGFDSVPLICFDNQIKPIFDAKCNMSGCHGGNGEGYNFTSYHGIMSGVTPGDPNKSSVYTVTAATWLTIMPPKGNTPLSEEQRTLLYMWIKQGATDTVTCK